MNQSGPTPQQLAAHLQKLRKDAGVTIDQLSANTGIPRDRIILIESGTIDQSVEEVARYALGLGMNLSVVFRLWEEGLN